MPPGAEAGARLFLGDRPSALVVVERFPDRFLPFAGGELKARPEALRAGGRGRPDPDPSASGYAEGFHCRTLVFR